MTLCRPCTTAALLVASCTAALSASHAAAQTTLNAEWIGDDSGGTWFDPLSPIQLEPDFDVNEDWDVPGSIEIGGVSFNLINFPSNLPGYNFDVEVGSADIIVTPGVPIRVSNINFGEGAGVSLEVGASWGIMSGTATGGTINVNQLGIDTLFTDLTINGQATFTGGGTVNMGDSVGTRVVGGAATTFSNILIIEDYLFQGGGALGAETMSIRNLAGGTIRANAATTLTIDPGQGNNIQNMGTMEAVSGSTLRIQQTAVVNTGGTLNAGTGGLIELFDMTVGGGTLAGGGLIRGSGTVRLETAVTNNGSYAVANGGTTILDGDLTNNGQVTIAGGSFLFNNDTTLTGGGDFILGVPLEGGTSVLGGVGGVLPTVTNADNTIRGGGNIGFMTLINQSGVIADEAGAPLTVLGNVTNQSSFTAQGATLNLRGAFDNSAGTISATGGTVALTHGATVTGGTISIDGSSTMLLNDAAVNGAAVTNATGGIIETGILGGRLNADVTNAGGATIRVAEGRLTLVQGGSYDNAGTIALESDDPFSAFTSPGVFVEDTVTLSGGGAVEMAASAGVFIQSVAGNTGTLINMDNTIRGAGHLGRNTMGIDNRATIDANAAPTGGLGSGVLNIDPGAGGLTNTGTMRASNGGTLHLRNGTYQNAGGTIQAGAGSTVNIDQGTHVFGGTLQSTGGSFEVLATDVLFDGIGMDIDAQVNVQSNGRLRLRGDITNRQTIALEGIAQLLIDGTVTLTGGGRVHLGDAGTRLTTFIDGTPDLLVNVDNTLSGSGGVLFLDIQSGGTVAPGNSPGTLTTGNFTQTADGTLEIELAGAAAGEFDVLNVQGTADLSGTLEVVLLPGLDVAAGTTFDVVTAQSLTANFDTLALPTGASGQDLIAIDQVGNTLRLTALEDLSIPIPEPGTGALLGLVLLGYRRRRRSA